MRAWGVEPDQNSYNTVMDAYARVGNVQNVVKIFKFMQVIDGYVDVDMNDGVMLVCEWSMTMMLIWNMEYDVMLIWMMIFIFTGLVCCGWIFFTTVKGNKYPLIVDNTHLQSSFAVKGDDIWWGVGWRGGGDFPI